MTLPVSGALSADVIMQELGRLASPPVEAFNIGDGANTTVFTSSIQSDGKVIIGGDFTSYSGTTTNRIARLHSNFVLDTGFNVGTGANSTVWTNSIQSDGKVIIGGAFTSYSGTTTNRIARLHTNGVLDTGFNVGSGANNVVYQAVIQSDGKVIVGGDFTSYSGTTRNRIARLHANGVLDTGFNVGTGANSTVNTISIQSDGKVIIGGAFTAYSGTTINRLARLHTNGVLDTGFNVGTGADSTVLTSSMQSDGKVIIGGAFTYYFTLPVPTSRLARIHSNGETDSSFNIGTGPNTGVNTTSIQSDGKVIIGGFFTAYSGTERNRIARLHTNGVLDTGFNVGTGANAEVYTTSIQSDGKVIIAGNFTTYSGTTKNRIARLHANGVLDTSFSGNTNGFIYMSPIQSDGKVIIGGGFTFPRSQIARLHVNGEFDTSFIVGTGISGSLWSISIGSDGKVIIGGDFTAYSGTTTNRIARLHTNGVLDTGFNVGTGANGTVNTTSIQSDGKVIIGGIFTSYSGTTINRLARLHTNGVLDTGFNVGTGANGNIEEILIQADGKVIIGGGGFTSYSGTTTNRIARLHSNGVLDTSFNVGPGANNIVLTCSIQSDGKIIIGGFFTSYNPMPINAPRVVRLHLNGVLDTGFNFGTGANAIVNTTSIQSDGKIIIGGEFTSYSGTTRNRIARLHANGVLDTGFNVGEGANSTVWTNSIGSDGKVIIGGAFTSYSGVPNIRIARLHSNGVVNTYNGNLYILNLNGLEERRLAADAFLGPGFLDTSFNVGTGANTTVNTIAVQSDGKVIIGGSFTSYSGTTTNRIARLHTNGVLDTGFNVGTGANSTVNTTSIQSDGKVIIGGNFTLYSGTTINRLARLHSNGILDTGFNVGTGFSGALAGSTSVITTSIQSDGKVIIGGNFTLYSGTASAYIARLHANGVLDTGFNVGTGMNNNGWVNTTSIQSDGKVIIGGEFTSYSGTERNRIARLHTNGVLDTGFNVGPGANGTVYTTSIQSDGKVIIGGGFFSYSGTTINRLARLHTNGVLDTGFNVGTGANSNVNTTSIQLDGKVIIGGLFISYSGTTTTRIARLHANGVLDTGFNVGEGANNRVWATSSIQSDGKVIIGGDFTSYSGTTTTRIARLSAEYIFNSSDKTVPNSIISFSDFYGKTYIG
jgi:uncharacterized delta-60 repeat protein